MSGLKDLNRPYPYYTIDKVIEAVIEIQENGGGPTPTPDLATVLTEGNETDGNNIVLSDGDTIDAASGSNQIDLNEELGGGIMLTTDAGAYETQGIYLSPGYNALFDYSTGGYIELDAESDVRLSAPLINLSSTAVATDVYIGSPTVANCRVFLPLLPTYADNAAALTGGLITNQVYKTSGGELRIVV
jgi:hypothetical protein